VRPWSERQWRTGNLAKTDGVDAAMLARMGVLLQPDVQAPANEILQELKDLTLARRALVRDRTAARNRSKHLSMPLLKRQNAQRLRQIEAQLRRSMRPLWPCPRRTTNGIDDTASFAAFPASLQGRRLRSWPRCRARALDQKQAASLAGLAPVTRQSGTWQGRAFIHGARADLAVTLHARPRGNPLHTPDLKQTLNRLTAAGKPAKTAVPAIMQKFIVLTNALLPDQRERAPKPA
jgi:transposase